MGCATGGALENRETTIKTAIAMAPTSMSIHTGIFRRFLGAIGYSRTASGRSSKLGEDRELLGFEVLDFEVLDFEVLDFEVLGFEVLGFELLGFGGFLPSGSGRFTDLLKMDTPDRHDRSERYGAMVRCKSH
jgi:hypothetical protein